MENNNQQHQPILYTEEQLMARLKFFIGICLALTLTGIVFVVLYSLIFVTQPLNAISPIDQKFFELIIPIATFLTGTLSGIMLSNGDKDAQKAALDAANKGWDRPTAPVSPPPSAPAVTNSFGSQPLGGFGNVGSTVTPPAFGAPAFGAPATGFGTTPGGFGSPAPVVTNSFGAQPLGSGSGFGSAPSTGFGNSTGVGAAAFSPAPAPVTGQVVTGFGGKPAPVMAPDPII